MTSSITPCAKPRINDILLVSFVRRWQEKFGFLYMFIFTYDFLFIEFDNSCSNWQWEVLNSINCLRDIFFPLFLFGGGWEKVRNLWELECIWGSIGGDKACLMFCYKIVIRKFVIFVFRWFIIWIFIRTVVKFRIFNMIFLKVTVEIFNQTFFLSVYFSWWNLSELFQDLLISPKFPFTSPLYF